MIRYHDSHCHLDLDKIIQKNIQTIEKNQIYTLAMTNLPSLFSRLNNIISSNYIRVSLGFHPELILEYKDLIPLMWDYLDKTRYIGEVGLDFSINKTSLDRDIQLKFFKTLLLKCNKKGGKIISIHSRKAENEIEEIIPTKFNGIIILHWYTGNIGTLKKLIDKNVYFSINKRMLSTKKGRNLILNIPIERIIIESDYPFTNEKQTFYLKEDLDDIFLGISQIKKLELDFTINIINSNFIKIIRS